MEPSTLYVRAEQPLSPLSVNLNGNTTPHRMAAGRRFFENGSDIDHDDTGEKATIFRGGSRMGTRGGGSPKKKSALRGVTSDDEKSIDSDTLATLGDLVDALKFEMHAQEDEDDGKENVTTAMQRQRQGNAPTKVVNENYDPEKIRALNGLLGMLQKNDARGPTPKTRVTRVARLVHDEEDDEDGEMGVVEVNHQSSMDDLLDTMSAQMMMKDRHASNGEVSSVTMDCDTQAGICRAIEFLRNSNTCQQTLNSVTEVSSRNEEELQSAYDNAESTVEGTVRTDGVGCEGSSWATAAADVFSCFFAGTDTPANSPVYAQGSLEESLASTATYSRGSATASTSDSTM